MTAENFCYWLQGLFEVGKPISLNAEQTRLIREHLRLAFKYDIDNRYPAEQRARLNAIHRGDDEGDEPYDDPADDPAEHRQTTPFPPSREIYVKC